MASCVKPGRIETSLMNCDSHSHNVLAPMGPCGKPCDQNCDEPCDDKPSVGNKGRWAKWLNNSLFNTLDLCFDDVYQEPKKILIVGGCRQMDLSQHIALMLPAAEIHLVDPDEAVAKKAQEEVCCRFKFIASPLESLPYETNQFDLTIAHNFLAYPQADWKLALDELARVTETNLMLSVNRPVLSRFAMRLKGFNEGLKEVGLELPETLPSRFDLLNKLTEHAKIKTTLAPLPWTVFMTQLLPQWEEKLVLAS